MIPFNSVFLLIFIYFLRQKTKIIENIKNDETLGNKFLDSLNNNSESNFEDPQNIDAIFNSMNSVTNDNDSLDFKNFGSKFFYSKVSA